MIFEILIKNTMNNSNLKTERPENLQYKSKRDGLWKNMREKDLLDSFENFNRLGYEIRLNPKNKEFSVRNIGQVIA